jgi:hypothetical protein
MNGIRDGHLVASGPYGEKATSTWRAGRQSRRDRSFLIEATSRRASLAAGRPRRRGEQADKVGEQDVLRSDRGYAHPMRSVLPAIASRSLSDPVRPYVLAPAAELRNLFGLF